MAPQPYRNKFVFMQERRIKRLFCVIISLGRTYLMAIPVAMTFNPLLC